MAGIFDPGIFDPGIFDTEAPSGGGILDGIDVRGLGIKMKVNGEPYTIPNLSSAQLAQWSFQDAAYDGQIGMGSICIPGKPGWIAGDRLAFYDQDDNFITLAFTMNRGVTRQATERLGIETKYQVMDANRLLIGRSLIDFRPGGVNPTAFADDLVAGIIALIDVAGIILDTTSWVIPDTTLLPNNTYNSDGAMDLIADLILYTGKTVFVRAIEDNSYELHFHNLLNSDDATLAISDLVSEQATDVFTPYDASVSWDAQDLKNDVEGRNQFNTVAGTNDPSIAAHGVGGIGFEAQMTWGASLDELEIFVNTLLNTAGDEKPTYECVIGPLIGSQVGKIMAGQRVDVRSDVMDLDGLEPVRLRTLTVTHDVEGHAVAGLWNAGLQFTYPGRQIASAIGLGGLGGYGGALFDPFNFADHVDITYGDLSAVPIGQSSTVRGQIQGVVGNAVTQIGVVVEFTCEEFASDDYTESDDWALSGETVISSHIVRSTTDRVGQAFCQILHDSDVSWAKVRVTATVVV